MVYTEQYLDPADTDTGLGHFLNSGWKEEGDGETDSAVQRHRHEHPARRDRVPRQHVHGEGHEHNNLARRKERRHIQATQIRAAHDLGYLFPAREEDRMA